MTNYTALAGISAALLLAGCIGLDAAAAEPANVVAILEDDAEGLLKVLTNPTGDPGEGHPETTQVYSGRQSIRIVPMQRFSPQIPGWAFPIREVPKPGEYRYLRFAWKAEGGTGIMLQLHDEKDWRIRYTAGRDMYSWGTKFVAEAPPQRWTVVTIDLFADHGAQTLTGIALTSFDARAAYFDHIYLARSVADLDRIDATGFRDKPLPELSKAELAALWSKLDDDDAEQSYQALWRLVAAKDQTVALLQEKLSGNELIPLERIARWIKDLDDDRYERREAAMVWLQEHAAVARAMLERVRDSKPSAEVQWRVKVLLRAKVGDNPQERLRASARRVLENIDTAESKALLEKLGALK